MSERQCWQDAQRAAEKLGRHEGDHRILLLLTRLPFVPAKVIAQFSGLRGEAVIYRSLTRLRDDGLIAVIRPRLQPGHTPQLPYLTELGLATIALKVGAEPTYLARERRLRADDLLALLPSLPQLMAGYNLLGAVASSRAGRPGLIRWERPWRRRYRRPAARAPITIVLPAGAVLSWDGEIHPYLLLPDLATFPLRAYRATLDHLFGLRAMQGSGLPALIVATVDQLRAGAWKGLLEEVRHKRHESPLPARVVVWDDLSDGLDVPAHPNHAGALLADGPGLCVEQHRLRPRRPTSRLPRLVGDNLALASSTATSRELSALRLSPTDRTVLDLVGRHPFLPTTSLAMILGWTERWARRRRDRLVDQQLIRLLTRDEVSSTVKASELVELTADGLKLVAKQQGLSLAGATRYNGLAGGGPDRPVGARRMLAANLAHTLAVDEIFVSLIDTARTFVDRGSDDALMEWRNAAACSRHHLRPDGYGIYRHACQLYGFFLEYDRGTMSARDYREKFRAYYDYWLSYRFRQDYDGLPTILVVASDNADEERIARIAWATAIGRGARLPMLLTCTWRISNGPSNPDGLLGPIWREVSAAFDDRRIWPL